LSKGDQVGRRGLLAGVAGVIAALLGVTVRRPYAPPTLAPLDPDLVTSGTGGMGLSAEGDCSWIEWEPAQVRIVMLGDVDV